MCCSNESVYRVVHNNHENFFSLPTQDREKLQSFAETCALVSTACLTAHASKGFRREWQMEAEKHGVSPPPDDPTELVVSLLYKLAQGDESSSDDLQSWIDMFKAVDLLAQTPAEQTGTLN
jgi:hypothetical protein